MQRADLLRYFVRFVGSIGLLLGVVFINIWVFLVNYRGLVTAFELLGYEPQPLSTDRLFGPLATALLGRATLADLFAFTLAGAISLGFFLVARSLMKVIDLASERFSGTAAADPVQRSHVSRAILLESAWLVMLGASLVFCARTDIELFHFRSVAQAMGMYDRLEAVAAVPTMNVLLAEHAEVAAMQLSYNNAWGYLGMTVICCIAIEYLIQKASTNYQLLMSVDLAGSLGDNVDEAAEYDDSRRVDNRVVGPTVASGSSTSGVDRAGGPTSVRNEELFDPASVRPELAAGEFSGTQPVADVRHEVIGRPGERVRMADALANSDQYCVDPATRQVWERRLWDELNSSGADLPKAA